MPISNHTHKGSDNSRHILCVHIVFLLRDQLYTESKVISEVISVQLYCNQEMAIEIYYKHEDKCNMRSGITFTTRW